ncbi:MAG TPA: helix-turn-helix domain-containing protein [Candidatus Limnocylindrales bacterium]|jgi:transcriptional regulator with XRE-family HTH domain
MSRLKRPELLAEAARRNAELMARLGRELRGSRLRRRRTQAQVGAIVGVAQSTISRMERGRGGSLSMDVWQRSFTAVDRELAIVPNRDALEEPSDAGHLAMQELVLRLGRRAGYQGSFELPTRPADPRRSADVCLRSDTQRLLILVEVWNTFGDIGAAVRSTNRKLAEAEALAVAIGGEKPYHVSGCWVVRPTRRNRDLVARYPELFAARFPGSSAKWVRAIVDADEPPSAAGLLWTDDALTRLVAWRRR